MAENTPPNTGGAEVHPNDKLDRTKQEMLAKWGEVILQIGAADVKIVQSVADIMGSLAGEVVKDPKSFFSNGDVDVQALVAALKAKSDSGSSAKGGVSGGDIVGGLSWSDIVDTIKALEGFLKDEKQFIMEILRLIFCGCKGTGW